MKIKFLFLIIFLCLLIGFELLFTHSKERISLEIPKIPLNNLGNNDSMDQPFNYNNSKADTEDMETEFNEFDRKAFRKNNTSSWTLKVASYNSQDDVLDDFKSLQQEGLKPYIRNEEKKGDKIYILYVGPNLNKNKILSIKSKVYDLIKKTPRVVAYNE